MAGSWRYIGPWKNGVAVEDLRLLFEMGLQYLSNRDTPEGYNMIALSNEKAVVFIATASKRKNAEIAKLIGEYLDA